MDIKTKLKAVWLIQSIKKIAFAVNTGWVELIYSIQIFNIL